MKGKPERFGYTPMKSEFGSYSYMITKEHAFILAPDEVALKDQIGLYVTKRDRVNSGRADPNRIFNRTLQEKSPYKTTIIPSLVAPCVSCGKYIGKDHECNNSRDTLLSNDHDFTKRARSYSQRLRDGFLLSRYLYT